MADRSNDRLAIERLNADYGYHLDGGDIDSFCALFTDDVIYSNGPRVLEGLDALRSFLASRTAGGPRTSRHMYSGLRIDFTGDDDAVSTSVWMSFAANGEPPINMATPFLVANVDDVYVRRDSGWFFKERRIMPAFINPDVPPPGAPKS